MTTEPKTYVIVEDGAEIPLFWNNETGFGNFKSADVFTQKERNELNLPVGGRWQRFSGVGGAE